MESYIDFYDLNATCLFFDKNLVMTAQETHSNMQIYYFSYCTYTIVEWISYNTTFTQTTYQILQDVDKTQFDNMFWR